MTRDERIEAMKSALRQMGNRDAKAYDRALAYFREVGRFAMGSAIVDLAGVT